MRRSIAVVSLLLAALAARADEGMWTFDDFPFELLAERHGVEITPEWLARVRLGVARLSGCTASFVSPEGLLLTNTHCVESCLAQHSSREESLIERGFLARSRDEELACGTQIADVLVETEDVTDEVLRALAGLDAVAANERRKETLTRLEQRCEEESRPLKCQAVTLYDGGRYFLYKYDRYDDVRLVFAPEAGIAAFGGDPDNFQFPRWCLDMALLRAYRDGAPAATPNHLRIDFAGPEAGDVVFVAGHPGSTDRQLTVEQLKTIRDAELPPTLLRASELRGRYIQFASTGPEAERIVRDPLNGLENGIKVRRKLLDALHDDEQLARKAAAERELAERVRATPELSRTIGDPWASIAAAQDAARALAIPYAFLEDGAGFNSRLFRYARTLVRGAAERAKPSEERLREYVDTALPRIEQQLRAAVPVYPELERLTLSFSLERMREWLGPDHPVVRRLLATESPDSLARALVEGSKLADPEVRMELWNGGQAAVDASDDPMIELARAVDAEARAIRKRYEDEVEAPVDLASEAIAKARFEVYGTSLYPDATFTLRINFGTVRGWEEHGEPVAPFTELARLYERATGRPPFALPERWIEARGRLDPRTRFNLVSTNDIVGGNSGSPLLNTRGDIVGLIFDGNIHSIAGRYWFDAETNRAVSVNTAIMRAALADVYQADELLAELGAGE
ncbi:MAG TPA: S46 family peptidase [Gammaproteobacteria bacterium]